MPYILHAKDEPATLDGQAFDSPGDAAAHMKTAGLQSTHKITFIATEDQIREWRERESNRFSSGEYQRVPWVGFRYRGRGARDHYAHLSRIEPGKIAYTKSIEHGLQDRQTRVRPGKYLQEFYSDVFTPEQIAAYVAECTVTAEGLQIATSADDIETVYRGGPSSCMGSSKHWTTGESPVRVYGDSDLALAYYGAKEHASARAIIWPAKKIYSRVYGGNGVLERLLGMNGYEHGSLEGARVRAIPCSPGDYLMPYVDGISSARLTRDKATKEQWIVLGEDGDIQTQNTCGFTPEEDTYHCDHCSENVSEDDYYGDGVCNSCHNENYTECHRCGDDVANDAVNTGSDEERYCTLCYRQRFTVCHDCDRTIRRADAYEHDSYNYCEDCKPAEETDCNRDGCSNTFDPEDFTSAELRDRQARGVDDCCSDCAETYTYCTTCGEYYEHATDHEDTPDPAVAFPGDATVIDGIRPERDLAPPAEPSYRAHCSTCNRDIPCPDTLSFFSPAFDYEATYGA